MGPSSTLGSNVSDVEGDRETMLQTDGEAMFQLDIEWMLWVG